MINSKGTVPIEIFVSILENFTTRLSEAYDKCQGNKGDVWDIWLGQEIVNEFEFIELVKKYPTLVEGFIPQLPPGNA